MARLTAALDTLRPLVRQPPLGSPQARRRVLHGDWHPLLRDWIDVLRLHYVAGAIVFFALGRLGSAWDLAFSAVAVLLVRALDPPRRIDLAFIVAMAFNGWGDALGLFDSLSWYDNLVHVTLPLAVGPLGYVALARLDVVPALRLGNTARHRFGMGLVAMCFGVLGATVYEVYEFVVDNLLGANLFISESDTVNDLADGLAGAAIGGALLAALGRSQLGLRRGSLRSLPNQRGGTEGEDGGAPAGEDDRGGVREGATEGAVEHHARGGADRRADDEVARPQPGQAAGVVEQPDGQAGHHPQRRDRTGAAALEPLGGGAHAPRQAVGELGASEGAREPEGRQRAERAAEQRDADADGTEQQSGDRAQQRAGDQQGRADEPGDEQQHGRPGAGADHERPEARGIVGQPDEGSDGQTDQRGEHEQS